MDICDQRKTTLKQAMCGSIIVLLTACGGGAGGVDPQDQPLSDAPVQATGNASIAADPSTSEFTPSLGAALNIDYEQPDQALASSDEFIELQWSHMQTCLQVSAMEPAVVVIDEKLTPTHADDDVVRHIDGQIQASSHVTQTSATIQVRAEDFNGTLGKPGAYLRSIMGRYLWLANGLEERDYPYACAKGE